MLAFMYLFVLHVQLDNELPRMALEPGILTATCTVPYLFTFIKMFTAECSA